MNRYKITRCIETEVTATDMAEAMTLEADGDKVGDRVISITFEYETHGGE